VSGGGEADRLSAAVLLTGSGYGALKAAEDLAESGIPVVWITGGAHFLDLPVGTTPFPEWPDDLNYQFRPLYLRVTRHRLVTTIPRARLASLEAAPGGFRAVIRQDPTYIDYDLCTGCGRCMEVCPLDRTDRPPLARSPAWCPSRALEMDKRKLSACRAACPLGVNVQGYMALTAAGRLDEALDVIRQDNPLPGICGRVCHHPCEADCRRAELDQPVAIREIKRFLSDHEVAGQGRKPAFAPPERRRSQRVAVVGSGPAGLTAAHYLNRGGFRVTVFESLPQAGGMLRAGINRFRLPAPVLDRELEALAESGVEFRTGATVRSLEELEREGYAAVVLATGTHRDLRLAIPGEELEGVVHCVSFLTRVNLGERLPVGERTVVIGAGNSAMDAARTALRLGAREVTILAIEREGEMPAHPEEVAAARDEGVAFTLGAAPIAFQGGPAVARILCRPARWSEPGPGGARRILHDAEETFTLEADMVIVAIGQAPHLEETGLAGEVARTSRGTVAVAAGSLGTSRPGTYAAGDVVTGPGTVIGAMAAGRRAAGEVIRGLTGAGVPWEGITPDTRGAGDAPPISEDQPRRRRTEPAERQPKVRVRDFEQVSIGLEPDQALAEAARCLQCGVCSECRACEPVCAEVGAIDHFRPPRNLALDCVSVIAADVADLPPGTPADLPGLFRLGDQPYTADLVNVLMAGGAHAGKAIARATDRRLPAVPREAEEEETPSEPRLGVFICRCNGVMAPEPVLERLRDLSLAAPGVRHAQLVLAACHPRGADLIAEAVRRHGLTRVILASCVCCPLEFQCISCNDQRNRARLHLFDRLGLSRSRFETVNLKDHLYAAEEDQETLFRRGKDLLRPAFIRSRFLGPLRQGTTGLGDRILVLGGSESGLACARNLALQGFRVLLLHRPRLEGRPLPEEIRDRPVAPLTGTGISQVPEAEVVGIDGRIGDFEVRVRENGREVTWRTDVVCLTDEHVLDLSIRENMTGLKKFYRYDFGFFHSPQPGLYRIMPSTLRRMSATEIGTALAAEVATAAAEVFMKDHELSPRVDPARCRGCGRCTEICPFSAVRLVPNEDGFFTAEVLRHNCVGCGGCVSRCPVTAMDMPYFSNELLEQMVTGVLEEE
jgi:NADPH-dependent glutamate synthase beta subunit-like oxidoreductase/NAD-dependent dihydropyrimidine dehydrogenase PreA subunit